MCVLVYWSNNLYEYIIVASKFYNIDSPAFEQTHTHTKHTHTRTHTHDNMLQYTHRLMVTHGIAVFNSHPTKEVLQSIHHYPSMPAANITNIAFI